MKEIPKSQQLLFEKAKKSKANAIKAKCLDCCCFQRVEVRNCTAVDCPLHPHRPYQGKDGDSISETDSDDVIEESEEEGKGKVA